MSDSQSEQKLWRSELSRTAKRSDPIQGTLYRESLVKEDMVYNAQLKILRSKLEECKRVERENHYKHCEKYAAAYFDAIKHTIPQSANSGPVEMADIE